MAIILHGPNWPSVRALREVLATVPETGSFTLGGPRYTATEQLARFRTAGVRTVEFTHSRAEAEAWVSQGHTVFGRRETHTHGSDIIGANRSIPPGRRWRGRDWWTKLVRSTDEWRVHVFDGSSIARGRKVLTGPQVSRWPIRSRRNGWTLDHTQRTPPPVRDLAKRAVAALPGYLYGAVDILVDENGNPLVLEVNRIPGMDNYTCRKYAEAIHSWIANNPHNGLQRALQPRHRIANGEIPVWYEGYEVV